MTTHTDTEVQQAIREAAADYPNAAQFTEQVIARAKNLLADHADHLIRVHGDVFWKQAERLVKMAQATNEDPDGPIGSLIEYTYAYLKEQIRFMQTKEYSHSDFEDVFKEVYDNPEVMGTFYLEGLMLTHAYWPIHFDIHRFFMEAFIPRVPDSGTGLEFGFGHGLYLLEVLEQRPNTKTESLDVSRFSIDYANRLLSANGVSPDRYTLGFGDARKAWPQADKSLNWGIFAEIIEHVPDPLYSLKELRRCLAPGAPMFATTVVNSNAIDHLYLFTETDQVGDMLREAGFEIVAEQHFRVADYGNHSQDPSIDVAYVCVPAE